MNPRPIRIVLTVSAMFFSAYLLQPAQAQRSDANPGAQRFMEYCAGCHGADARGGEKAPSLVVLANIGSRSDAELFQIVHDGTRGGMPPFAQIGDANIEAVVRYVRELAGNAATPGAAAEAPITGNVDAGRALYFGKARCSKCHLMRGEGGFIAGNLTNYGRTRMAQAILWAITNPDSPLVPSSQVVVVTLKTGKKITGVLRNEDAFTLALQTEDGRFRLLSRGGVADVQYSGHSLMPRDYSTRLSTKELNDIVSFLMVESRGPHPDNSAAVGSRDE